MRAREFITEKKLSTSSISDEHSHASSGIHIFSDGNIDRFYVLNRIMTASGSSDGTDNFEAPLESWAGRNNTAHPYTQVEADKLKAAYKKLGIKNNDLNHGDNHSAELNTTNVSSPVRAFKGYGK